MAASLPTEDASDKAVDDFGIGTYDASESDGEDAPPPAPPALPGTVSDVFSPDRLLSYPNGPKTASVPWHLKIFAAASELPSDEDNPPARSDYYDKTVIGQAALPGVAKNEDDRDGGYGPFGHVVEDVVGPSGFPSEHDDNSSGGKVVASVRDEDDSKRRYDEKGEVFFCGKCGKASDWCECKEGPVQMKKASSRTATNIQLVDTLTSEFLKEYGKKDLTKRHVLAFLQLKGEPQFLSSDIVRCLKLSHSIYVKDVLDEFPVARTAAVSGVAAIRDRLISLEAAYITSPEVSSVYRRCAAHLAKVMASLERIERNG